MEPTREKIKIFKEVFPSNESIDLLYREASLLAFTYNSELKKEGRSEGFVSPGRLHASAVLHLIYQIVLSARVGDTQPDFFTRRINTVIGNEELLNALAFYSKTFPSPALNESKPGNEKRITEDMRGFFVHQVLLQNPALLAASKPFIAPDGIVYPEGIKALSSILSSFVKDDLRDGRPNTEDVFTMLQLPARLYPNSLEEQIRYILRLRGIPEKDSLLFHCFFFRFRYHFRLCHACVCGCSVAHIHPCPSYRPSCPALTERLPLLRSFCFPAEGRSRDWYENMPLPLCPMLSDGGGKMSVTEIKHMSLYVNIQIFFCFF